MSSRDRSRRRSLGQKGFSLLEVLVAFTVLALSLGVLMRIFSDSLRNVDVTTKSAQATAIAESLLAQVGRYEPLSESHPSGTIGNMFHWQIDTMPYEYPLAEPALDHSPEAAHQFAPLELWRIDVLVAWGNDGLAAQRTVALSTLRAQPAAMR